MREDGPFFGRNGVHFSEDPLYNQTDAEVYKY